jgi:hypothetical protein
VRDNDFMGHRIHDPSNYDSLHSLISNCSRTKGEAEGACVKVKCLIWMWISSLVSGKTGDRNGNEGNPFGVGVKLWTSQRTFYQLPESDRDTIYPLTSHISKNYTLWVMT